MPNNTHDILRKIVDEVECKPGWVFHLVNSEEEGLRLRITDTECVNSYSDPPEPMPLAHFFPVPTATYNYGSWLWWVFSCCLAVENHELGEWFRIDDKRPFAPMHGPGENPYVITQVRSETDVLTAQDGSIRSKVDTRPASCRFRLQEEGKSYPRSSCTACGKNIITGLGTFCQR